MKQTILFGLILLLKLALAEEKAPYTPEEWKVEEQRRKNVLWQSHDKSIDPSLLPVHINVSYYEKYVVNPSTNKAYSGKPWFIFAYWHHCGFCVTFKPDFEKIASKNTDVANWGYIDGYDDEYLKIPYNFTQFPTLMLIKNETVYVFNGVRSETDIVEFIKSSHAWAPVKKPIPPRLTYLGLQYIYL